MSSPTLPPDIILQISTHLPLLSLTALSSTSHFYRCLLTHPILTLIRRRFISTNTFHFFTESHGWRALLDDGKSIAIYQDATFAPEGTPENLKLADWISEYLLVKSYVSAPVRGAREVVEVLFGRGARDEGEGRGKGGVYAMKFLYDYLKRRKQRIALMKVVGDEVEFRRREREMVKRLLELAREVQGGDVLGMALDEDLLERVVEEGNESVVDVLVEMGEVDGGTLTERCRDGEMSLLSRAIERAMRPGRRVPKEAVGRRVGFARFLTEMFPEALEECLEGEGMRYTRDAMVARRFMQRIAKCEMRPFPELPSEITLRILSHLGFKSLLDFSQTSRYVRAAVTPFLLYQWGRARAEAPSETWKAWSYFLLWFLVVSGCRKGAMKQLVEIAFGGPALESNGGGLQAIIVLLDIVRLQHCPPKPVELKKPELPPCYCGMTPRERLFTVRPDPDILVPPRPHLHLGLAYLDLLHDPKQSDLINSRTEELMRELFAVATFPIDYLTPTLSPTHHLPNTNDNLLQLLFTTASTPLLTLLIESGTLNTSHLAPSFLHPDGTPARWLHRTLETILPAQSYPVDYFTDASEESQDGHEEIYLDAPWIQDTTRTAFALTLIRSFPGVLNLKFGNSRPIDAPALVMKLTTDAVRSYVEVDDVLHPDMNEQDNDPFYVRLMAQCRCLLSAMRDAGANFELALGQTVGPWFEHPEALEGAVVRWQVEVGLPLLVEMGVDLNTFMPNLDDSLNEGNEGLKWTPFHPRCGGEESKKIFMLFLEGGWNGIDLRDEAGLVPVVYLVGRAVDEKVGQAERDGYLEMLEMLVRERPACLEGVEWRGVVELVRWLGEGWERLKGVVKEGELVRRTRGGGGVEDVVVDGSGGSEVNCE